MEILEARHLVQVALAAQPDILEILRAVLQDLEPVHGDEHDLAPSPRSFSAYARLQFGAAAAVRRAIVARTLHGLDRLQHPAVAAAGASNPPVLLAGQDIQCMTRLRALRDLTRATGLHRRNC